MAAVVSGTIHGPVGASLADICVNLQVPQSTDDNCNLQWAAEAATDASGTYSITIPVDTQRYYIQTDVSCGNSTNPTTTLGDKSWTENGQG